MRLEDICVVVTSRNDADTIGDCLESAREFGTAVVIDAFSTDGTVDIARRAGAVIYSRPWGDAADQKNWAMTRAPGRWVLMVDACETVSDDLRERIKAADDGVADGYVVRVHNEYLGKVMKSRASGLGVAVRLFAQGTGRFVLDDEDATGTSVETAGKTAELDGAILRRGYRDISVHFEAINRDTTAAARDYIKCGGRLARVRMVLQPALRFWRLYLLQGGIRDGARGLMYCMLSAYESFIEYSKAWEIRDGEMREQKRQREETA
jgi:glycosyltransferase involved in cell wall biosynthesis